MNSKKVHQGAAIASPDLVDTRWSLYWALRGLLRGDSPSRRDQKGEGEEMVRDPQCGVYIPHSNALKRRVRGETVFFCSRECEGAYKEKARM